jgi:hypothetical protein
MTSSEKTSRRKPGRPRKYGQGRINATVRFTSERHAELQAEAKDQGRSFSEQVEYIVEHASSDRELIADLRRDRDGWADRSPEDIRAVTEYALEQMDKLKAVYAAELGRMKEAYALQEGRLAEIVEAAVTRALQGGRK